ncbi:MAG: hypothetical protein ACOX81_04580 [Candidatus Heteroscillospira sp.]
MGDLFCGWYFRCVSQNRSLAVIPAAHGRSFSIQLITGTGSWSVPVSAPGSFVSPAEPRAALGENLFSPEGVSLHLEAPGLAAKGELRFHGLSPFKPDIMGPFRHVPFMECRHSLYSLRHMVSGRLRVNGTDYVFDDDCGYIEGDRGRSFPRRYAWSQCPLPEGALMLAAADIPIGPIGFTGVISAVSWRGEQYRLATYNGAALRRPAPGELEIRRGGLKLRARLLEENSRPLAAPNMGRMGRTIHESVSCRAFYSMEKDGETLFALESPLAAFEYEY